MKIYRQARERRDSLLEEMEIHLYAKAQRETARGMEIYLQARELRQSLLEEMDIYIFSL